MIISVHIPRTAGTHFRQILRRSAAIHLKEDYFNPIMYPAAVRNSFATAMNQYLNLQANYEGINCLHGHFIAYKYQHLWKRTGHPYITWLRDPLDRLISHYNYNQTTNPIQSKSFFKWKMRYFNWSFEKFALSSDMQNFYQRYFWRFPAEQFDCIGITEHFEEDLKYIFEHYFNIKRQFKVAQRKINRSKVENPEISPELVEKIKVFHAADFALYAWATEQRKQRLARTNF